MNPKTKKYVLIGGAVVAVAAIWWFWGRKKKSDDKIASIPKIQAPKGKVQAGFKKGMTSKGKPVEQTTANQ
jgi:hypothetical protein